MEAETHGHLHPHTPACLPLGGHPHASQCPYARLACLAVKQVLPAHAWWDGSSLSPIAHTIAPTHVPPCPLQV